MSRRSLPSPPAPPTPRRMRRTTAPRSAAQRASPAGRLAGRRSPAIAGLDPRQLRLDGGNERSCAVRKGVPVEDRASCALAERAAFGRIREEPVDQLVEVPTVAIGDDAAIEFVLDPIDLVGDDECPRRRGV